MTTALVDTTLHGRALWPHPDQDGDGVEDLLSTAGGGEELPDPRKGAFDLISSSSGEILAGGEFGAWGAWEFFLNQGSPGEAPQLASYFLRGKRATHLLVHSWAIKKGEAGATFVSTPCAAIPLPEGAVGRHTYWVGPKLLRTEDPRLAYLACNVKYKPCLLQLSGDPLAPALSMAWPRADRPWLPEALPEVEYHWVVLPDLDSDGFDELAVGPSGPPLPRSEQPPPRGVAPQPEPQASLLVLSGKDFHVLRVVDLPGFGRRDVAALTVGRLSDQLVAEEPGSPLGVQETSSPATLFAYCYARDARSLAESILRIDPLSGQVDSTLTTEALVKKVARLGGSWGVKSGGSLDASLLHVDSPRPLLVLGHPDVCVNGSAVCIDPTNADVLWAVSGRSWGAMGDYHFGATSCWLRAATGPGLVAIASPYIHGGQASISFFRLEDGLNTVRIDCVGE